MYREKRNFARMALHAKASMHLDDQILAGEVKNLCMKGAFVTTARQMEINDVVAMTIYRAHTTQILCDPKAKVVWRTDRGRCHNTERKSNQIIAKLHTKIDATEI
jgi:hypothetical protein